MRAARTHPFTVHRDSGDSEKSEFPRSEGKGAVRKYCVGILNSWLSRGFNLSLR